MAPTSASASKAKLGRRKRAATGNKGVGIDFKKVKHKIGKRLPRAANDTNTEVRARAIALPGQRTLTADKSGAAVSSRGLTLAELLAQWPHPSEKVRKGGLQQALELLQAHPSLVARHAGPLVARVSERLSDGSPQARQALLALLKPPSPLLPELRRCGALAAFSPLLAAHLSAALTHLDAGVRADALAALEAVADASPSVLASPPRRLAGWLGHYAALLSRAHRGRTVKAQALGPLARVLGSSARVTRRLAREVEMEEQAGGGGGGGRREQKQQGAGAGVPPPPPLGAARLAFCPAAGAGAGLTPAALLRSYCGGLDPVAAAADSTSIATTEVQAAALELLEASFGCWAEAAPGTLSASPEFEAAGALRDVLAAGNQLVPLALGRAELAVELVGGGGAAAAAAAAAAATATESSTEAARRARAARCARAVLPRLLPHFPAREPAMPPPPEVADAVARYNLEAAQLLATLVAALAGERGGREAAGNGGGGGGGNNALLASLEARARAALVDYLCGALSTGRAVPGGGDAPSTAAAPPPQQQQVATLTSLACLRAARVALPALPAGGAERRELLAAVCAAGSLPAAGGRKRRQQQQAEEAAATEAGEDGGVGGGAAGGGGVLAARLALQRDLLEAHLLRARRSLRLPNEDDDDEDEENDEEEEEQQQLLQQQQAEQEMAGWLTGAPRLLWEAAAAAQGRRAAAAAAGSAAAAAAADTALEAIAAPLLSMLHASARLCGPGSPLEGALRSVQPMLAPLLAVSAPAAPAAAAAAATVRPGPLASLSPATQELGLSLLAHLPGPLDAALLKAVAMALRCPSPAAAAAGASAASRKRQRQAAAAAAAAQEEEATKDGAPPAPAYGDAAASRLLEAVLLAASPPSAALPPESYLSLAATLLAAPTPSSSSSVPFSRHRLVAALVAQRLHWYGPPARLAELAAAPLLPRWEDARRQQPAAASGEDEDEAAAAAAAAAESTRALAFSLLSLSAAAAGAWTAALGADPAGEAAWAARAEARALRPPTDEQEEEHQDEQEASQAPVLPAALSSCLPRVVSDWAWGSAAAAAAAAGSSGGETAAAAAAETAVVEALPMLARCCCGGQQSDPALEVLGMLLRAGLGEDEDQTAGGVAATVAAARARLEGGGDSAMATAALRAALAIVDCPLIHEMWRHAASRSRELSAAGERAALDPARRLRAALAGGSGATAGDLARSARRLETRLAECFAADREEEK